MLEAIGFTYSFDSYTDQFIVYLSVSLFQHSYMSDECFDAFYEHLLNQVIKALGIVQSQISKSQELVIDPVVPDSPELESLLSVVIHEAKASLGLITV